MPIFYLKVLPLAAVPGPLTYTTSFRILPGTLVRISLRNSKTIGLVIATSTNPPEYNFKFLPIIECIYENPILDESNLKVIQWLICYYACSTNVALETALPMLLRQGKPFPVNYMLRTTAIKPKFKSNCKQQTTIYNWILKSSSVSQEDFTKTFKHQTHVLKRLIEKGYVERYQENPISYIPSTPSLNSFTPTEEQSQVINALQEAITAKTFSTHLLWGITGSGKTEIYHQLIIKAKEFGQQTLYLVPEIMLSEQAMSKIQVRLNQYNVRVAIWHSQLKNSEKLHIWQQAISGHIDVILGTRSALFVPLKNLGLVIVDEEHETSYKQSDNPRYHGRDLAIYRAHSANALCVLGSATPSIETWANVRTGKYTLHRLTHRPSGVSLPKIHLADMRYEKPNFEGSFILSNLLREKINDRLEKHEQTLLFLNRRGYAPYLFCPNCETQLKCPNCDSLLVYHKNDNTLQCHLCDHKTIALKYCSKCHTPLKLSVGLGTQRIETCLQHFYKKARILRLDSDIIAQHPYWYSSILNDDYDIIVGTQILAKGLDFPNLTLAGIIQADGPSSLEDFRTSERTFQLLIQVSGRTGRFKQRGEVIVQSFNPQSDCIQYGLSQNVLGFLDKEYALRQTYQYPPFRHMIRHIFRCRSEKILQYTLKAWTQHLQKTPHLNCEILGPSIPYQNKINGYYRMHLIYLTHTILASIDNLQKLRYSFKMPTNIIDLLDIDPVDFR